MKIRFLGAINGEVTGSCTHFLYDRTKIEFLVDCGMFQGEWESDKKNRSDFSFDPKKIKFVILTHAHVDHCGLIPKLYKKGFSGKVICTSATAKLAMLQFDDISKNVKRLYNKTDIDKVNFRCLDLEDKFGLSRLLTLDKDLKISFIRSSHVLGSVSILLRWIKKNGEWENIVLSGDLGCSSKDNPYGSLLAAGQIPYRHSKYTVLESTYGDKTREEEYISFKARTSKINELIQKNIIGSHKILIIPSFSLQRTQEILFDLYYILGKENNYAFDNKSIKCKIQRVIERCNDDGLADWVYEGILEIAKHLPEREYKRLENAFEKRDESKFHWHLKKDSGVTFEEIQATLTLLKPVKVVLDSPLARKMASIYSEELCRRQKVNPEETLYRNRRISERFGIENEKEVDNIIRKIFPKNIEQDYSVSIGRHKIEFVDKYKIPESSSLKNQGIILITGSGMCEGGPIISHLKEALYRPDVVILTTGYMARESLGNKLVSIANSQIANSKNTISSINVGNFSINTSEIHARIIQLGSYYSGHADANILISFLTKQICDDENQENSGNRVVFLNHGSENSRNRLKSKIEQLSFKDKSTSNPFRVELPSDNLKWFDLDSGNWLSSPQKKSDNQTEVTSILESILAEQKKSNALLEKIIALLNNSL